MVNNSNWFFLDEVVTSNSTFTNTAIPAAPKPKLKTVKEMIEEEVKIYNQRYKRPDPYSDPDIYI